MRGPAPTGAPRFLQLDSRDEKTALTTVKRYELRSTVVIYRGSSFLTFFLGFLLFFGSFTWVFIPDF
jgi:hypothetical protein